MVKKYSALCLSSINHAGNIFADNGSGRALRTGIGIGIVIGIVIGSGFVGVVCVCIVILRSRKKFRKL